MSQQETAPEILNVRAKQAIAYDQECDIWSLGVVLYIMYDGVVPSLCTLRSLSGTPPFYSEHTNSRLSPGMIQRIRTATFEFDDDKWETVSADGPCRAQPHCIDDALRSQRSGAAPAGGRSGAAHHGGRHLQPSVDPGRRRARAVHATQDPHVAGRGAQALGGARIARQAIADFAQNVMQAALEDMRTPSDGSAEFKPIPNA